MAKSVNGSQEACMEKMQETFDRRIGEKTG
jgi:hypothetical protein